MVHCRKPRVIPPNFVIQEETFWQAAKFFLLNDSGGWNDRIRVIRVNPRKSAILNG
jgi:hypothetical protein